MYRPNRLALVSIVMLLTLSLGALILPAALGAQDTPMTAQDFHNAMRKLWEDHIQWTRNYIISVAADLPDADLVAERLLQNQDDIGNAVKPFYGDEAGNQLSQLLRDHIMGAVDILTAAKAGDTAGMDAAVEAWRVNGDDIATFLNGANPDNWPLEDLMAEMQMHLDLTLEEAQARLGSDFEADIAAYDEVHEHILGFADVLSNGIVAQFPDMFTTMEATTAPAAEATATTDVEAATPVPADDTAMTSSFTVPLSGPQEVPGPGDADATGTATITINAETNEVCWDITVMNAMLPATNAHIHVGALGEPGDVVVPLSAPDAGGLASGCATAEGDVVAAILANPGGYYVNVHTTDFPDGALRGQLT